jgi:hypothetical protein
MTGEEVALIITACATLISAVGSVAAALIGAHNAGKLAEQAALQAARDEVVRKLELNTNSIKDALVSSTAKAAEAVGHAAGLEQGRQEAK